MPSASNSWPREKVASAIFDLASASAPICGSPSTSLATRLTIAAWRIWSSRIAAWRAITCAISCDSTEASFGRVVGEREQAARDVELAGRQREGVDRGRVQDRDLVMQVRPLGRGDQLLDGAVEQRLRASDCYRRRHRRRGCGDARAAPASAARRARFGGSGRIGPAARETPCPSSRPPPATANAAARAPRAGPRAAARRCSWSGRFDHNSSRIRFSVRRFRSVPGGSPRSRARS